MKNSITDRVFEVLKQREIKDAQLSRTLGVSRTTVSEWRNGKSTPSAKMILKFLHHFPEVDANWLIRGEEKKGNIHYGPKFEAPVLNDGEPLSTENKHLKEIIEEKNEQIKLLKKMLKITE